MQQWSPRRYEIWANRYHRAISPEVAILSEAVAALDDFDRHCRPLTGLVFDVRQLLDYNVLKQFLAREFKITEWWPIGAKRIRNYPSWLRKAPDGKTSHVWIGTGDPQIDYLPPGAPDWGKANRPILKLLALLFHEGGHMRLNHRSVDVSSLPPGALFPSMWPDDEWEAWLFAEFLRAFIVADYAAWAKTAADTGGVDDTINHL